MQNHMLENPQGDLRSLDMTTLPSDPKVLEHDTSIGLDLMPDAFPDDLVG